TLYDHPVRDFQLVETHISWVILTGEYAYKIKKPVNFGFLDFSSLDSRRHFCHKELELNRRLAPALYLDVLPITGTPASPQLGGTGEPFEYAIKMRQFDQEQLLDRIQVRGELTLAHLDELSDGIARFHQEIAQADPASEFGQPDQAFFPVQQNFDQIRPLLSDTDDLKRLAQLEAWAQASFERLRSVLTQRKANGFIRECHGDIHLGSITVVDGHVTLFDCIEFNEAFRWTDVMCDIAFLIMDLESRGLNLQGNHVINRYLEQTGDYEGMAVLVFYKAYRAMVRAKVALLTKGAPGLNAEAQAQLHETYRGYAELAESYTFIPNRCLLITHGVSGSGKSTLTSQLVDRLGLIRLRSDLERKRLHGLTALDRSGSDLDGGIYTANATEATYQRLADLANNLLSQGYAVVVDAPFLRHTQRQLLELVAENQSVAFAILTCEAELDTIRQWIQERETSQQDASEAGLQVLEKQLRERDPLQGEELTHQIVARTDQPETLEPLLVRLGQRLTLSVADV